MSEQIHEEAVVVAERRKVDDVSGKSTWLVEKLNAFETKLDAVSNKLDTLDNDVRSGVPEGGFLKHLEFHRHADEEKRLKRERWNKFVGELLTKGGWAAFIFIAYSVWEAIKTKVSP